MAEPTLERHLGQGVASLKNNRKGTERKGNKSKRWRKKSSQRRIRRKNLAIVSQFQVWRIAGGKKRKRRKKKDTRWVSWERCLVLQVSIKYQKSTKDWHQWSFLTSKSPKKIRYPHNYSIKLPQTSTINSSKTSETTTPSPPSTAKTPSPWCRPGEATQWPSPIWPTKHLNRWSHWHPK